MVSSIEKLALPSNLISYSFLLHTGQLQLLTMATAVELKLADSRMHTISQALAVFVFGTSSIHLIRMVTPELTGPVSELPQNLLMLESYYYEYIRRLFLPNQSSQFFGVGAIQPRITLH